MVKAPPDNLGSRQRALNVRVNDAVSSKLPFTHIKNEPETTEVDKLYKIDVAAKYKNVDYIVEMLKSGDSLYTSRSLKKSQWLFTDEYSHLINPEYLQNNIFPLTSLKMKRKIINAAAARVKTPKRAEEFFHYCMKEKMKESALTAFLYTTEDFKLKQLRENKDPAFKTLENKDMIYFRFLVGKSFILLDALLNFISINWKISTTARKFKDFFTLSEEKYLDIAEKYVSTYFGFQTDKFDENLSESIMKRHKHRVLTKPKFYVNTVHTDVLVKYSTIDDAKIYAKTLLPDTASRFWSLWHYTIFRSVFRIIPHEKTYDFFKNYFAEHYPGAEYEMHPRFYEQKYYEFLTLQQREEWAFRHLKSEKQILGVGCDYLWYRFINFNAAFEEIKRLVSITKEADKRNNMVEVLVESARNDRELEALFTYYYKRHMNELRKYRENFLNKVLSGHNVFEFDEACWKAFYTLMLAIEVTTDENEAKNDANNDKYKTVALLYHILHDQEMPEALITYLNDRFRIHFIQEHLENISDEEKEQKLHEYFFSFYMRIITESKNSKIGINHFKTKIEPKWNRYFENINKSMQMFNEDGEKYETSSSNQSRKRRRHCCSYHINGRSLIRDLKTDKEKVISNLPRVQVEFEASRLKLNTFLNKIRIYFPDDVTPAYLEMFQSLILNDKLVNGEYQNRHRMIQHVAIAVKTGVNAIFHLADEEVKLDFMKKYYPVYTKEERKALGLQHFRIQRAVCRYACLSRPPVPFSSIVVYMKGDTAKACTHIFNTYLSLLPLPMCQQFVHLVIDTPVSIQKHAIRLAFQCFNFESLKVVILNIWKNTKNISLRSIIYKAFYDKVVNTKAQHFYGVLKMLTQDLYQDDEKAVFDMTVSKKVKLPDTFLGDYIEVVWEAVDKFKDIEPYLSRKADVINFMQEHISIMREEFLTIVVYDHINIMLLEEKLPVVYSDDEIVNLYKNKWNLTGNYIVYFLLHNATEKYVQLAQFIFRKLFQSWDKIVDDKYVYQTCCWFLVNNLKKLCIQEKYGIFENTIPLFEGILKIVDIDLPYYNNYLLKWELQLILITANVIKNNKENSDVDDESKAVAQFAEAVAKLILEYVTNNRYFMTFAGKVKKLIINYVKELLKLKISDDWEDYLNKSLISLAEQLAAKEVLETYLLAIQILPTDEEECDNDTFKCLIKKLQDCPNEEVQLCLYQKLQQYCEKKETDAAS